MLKEMLILREIQILTLMSILKSIVMVVTANVSVAMLT